MPFFATLKIILLNKLYNQLAPPCTDNFTCKCPIENEQPVVLKTGWPLEFLSNHIMKGYILGKIGNLTYKEVH